MSQSEWFTTYSEYENTKDNHRFIKMRSNIAFNNKIAEITDEFGSSTLAEKFGLPWYFFKCTNHVTNYN